MSDIVERLRARIWNASWRFEGADEIERLRAELDAKETMWSAIRAATIEECAQVAWLRNATHEIIEAIRALKEQK